MERTLLDATLTTRHEADAQHIAQPTQSTTTGITGHCVVIQQHHQLAGEKEKTLTTKMQNTYTTDYHDTEKRIITVPDDLQFLPTVYFISLDPTDSHDTDYTKV